MRAFRRPHAFVDFVPVGPRLGIAIPSVRLPRASSLVRPLLSFHVFIPFPACPHHPTPSHSIACSSLLHSFLTQALAPTATHLSSPPTSASTRKTSLSTTPSSSEASTGPVTPLLDQPQPTSATIRTDRHYARAPLSHPRIDALSDVAAVCPHLGASVGLLNFRVCLPPLFSPSPPLFAPTPYSQPHHSICLTLASTATYLSIVSLVRGRYSQSS